MNGRKAQIGSHYPISHSLFCDSKRAVRTRRGSYCSDPSRESHLCEDWPMKEMSGIMSVLYGSKEHNESRRN